MRDGLIVVRNPRGSGLVMAILVLLFITLLAAALMQNITTEEKSSGEHARGSSALNYAESGVAEATERVRHGEVPDNQNPRMVTQIFLASSGPPPLMGADTVALVSSQTPPFMSYSTPGRSADVLTVRYKTDATRDKIYRFDPAQTPNIQTATGQPIFVIASTGRVGNSNRTILTEVTRVPIQFTGLGALVGLRGIVNRDETWSCGYDHVEDTPTGTARSNGRDRQSGSCNEDLANQKWELPGGHVAGCWTQGKLATTHKSDQWGSPPLLENAGTFYTGPWDALGMTRVDFFGAIGDPIRDDRASQLRGALYYKPEKDHLLKIEGGNGEGLLYVEGDLEIQRPFTFRGLIYCTGNIRILSQAWVLGSVVSEDRIENPVRPASYGSAFLYSRGAVIENVGRFIGRFVTLSWREVPHDAIVAAGASEHDAEPVTAKKASRVLRRP